MVHTSVKDERTRWTLAHKLSQKTLQRNIDSSTVPGCPKIAHLLLNKASCWPGAPWRGRKWYLARVNGFIWSGCMARTQAHKHSIIQSIYVLWWILRPSGWHWKHSTPSNFICNNEANIGWRGFVPWSEPELLHGIINRILFITILQMLTSSRIKAPFIAGHS